MRNATALNPPSFATLVQQFFTEYLVTQRAVSPRTVACYRDAIVLYLELGSQKLSKSTEITMVSLRSRQCGLTPSLTPIQI